MPRFENAINETDAQKKLMRLLENKDLAVLVGTTLAEIAVELADAKVEAGHWKKAFETVRLEIRTLVGIVLAKQGSGERIVVTEKELRAIPENLELYVGTPEPGVRIYELRTRAPGAKSQIDSHVRSLIAKPH